MTDRAGHGTKSAEQCSQPDSACRCTLYTGSMQRRQQCACLMLRAEAAAGGVEIVNIDDACCGAVLPDVCLRCEALRQAAACAQGTIRPTTAVSTLDIPCNRSPGIELPGLTAAVRRWALCTCTRMYKEGQNRTAGGCKRFPASRWGAQGMRQVHGAGSPLSEMKERRPLSAARSASACAQPWQLRHFAPPCSPCERADNADIHTSGAVVGLAALAGDMGARRCARAAGALNIFVG